MAERKIDYNNKILNCIIDICGSHPPRFNNIGIDDESFLNDDFFKKNVEKYFSMEEIISYKGKEQYIHDYNQFIDNDLFYKSLLNDFKLYISKIIFRKKKLALIYPKNYDEFIESLFDNNISFIYFYNFILFMKDISRKLPEIINESKYKIDLILMISIFSPDYHITFENGVKDKYGINYESYSILMIELIDLIKQKNYDKNKEIVEIENYEFKYPIKWNFYINQIEIKILNFLLFKNYINNKRYEDAFLKKYLSNNDYEINFDEYSKQIEKIDIQLKKIKI